MTFFMIQT